MSVKSFLHSKSGDTIVEVTFSIAIFALVSILTVNLMNSGISTAQASLEITMARNEIDAQAEALRFIHNSYLSEREFPVAQQTYRNLWKRLTREVSSVVDPGHTILPNQLIPLTQETCSVAYNGDADGRSLFTNSAFIINTRRLDPAVDVNEVIVTSAASSAGTKFVEAPMYPRIVFSTTGSTYETDDTSATDLVEFDDIANTETTFRKVSRVEGIWVSSVRDATDFDLDINPNPTADELSATKPEFYDFHIRTCWYAPGRQNPTTIGTIIRLYNPEYIEAAR